MIVGVNHVTLTVSDLDRSFRFYVDVLGCKPRARWKRGIYLEAGSTWLCLELCAQVTPRTDDSHIAFAVSALPTASLPRWKENRSEGESIYFLDPDGHKLELHVGDLETRLAACRAKPYDDMEFF